MREKLKPLLTRPDIKFKFHYQYYNSKTNKTLFSNT